MLAFRVFPQRRSGKMMAVGVLASLASLEVGTTTSQAAPNLR